MTTLMTALFDDYTRHPIPPAVLDRWADGYPALAAPPAELATQAASWCHPRGDAVLIPLHELAVTGDRHAAQLILIALTPRLAAAARRQHGDRDYVTKPIQATEVLARVRTHLRISTLQKSLQEEIAMRREAEEQLRDSLDRALLVAAADGKIHFATRLAQTLLTRFFADRAADHLPNPLQSLLNGSGTTPSLPHGFEAKLLRPASADELGVLELNCHDAPKPAILLNLGLTPREAEVLSWLAQGKSNPEIAVILAMSEGTVKKHLEHVFEKLGVDNRNAATLVARENLARR